MYIPVCVCIYMCSYIYVYVCIHTYMCTNVYPYIQNTVTHDRVTHVTVSFWTFLFDSFSLPPFLFSSCPSHVCMCIYIHVNIHIWIHLCIHCFTYCKCMWINVHNCMIVRIQGKETWSLGFSFSQYDTCTYAHGNDLFTTMFTAQMGRGKLQWGHYLSQAVTCICICIYMHVSIYMYITVGLGIRVGFVLAWCVQGLGICSDVQHAYIYMHMYACSCIYVYTLVYVQIHTSVHVHTYVVA